MPSWFSSDRFDVEAKADGNPTEEQMWSMVRSLLADRFKLRVHLETREVPVYALVVARSDGVLGGGIRPSACAAPPALIVGGGLNGLTCALLLAPRPNNRCRLAEAAERGARWDVEN